MSWKEDVAIEYLKAPLDDEQAQRFVKGLQMRCHVIRFQWFVMGALSAGVIARWA